MQQFLKYNFSRGFECKESCYDSLSAKTSGFFKLQKIRTKEKSVFQRVPKIIVILGQTATGKSNLAVKIAKKIKGEIISADSRQVYKGLDIGTGKITTQEMRGISHHLLDVTNPKKVFTVSDFVRMTNLAIAEIVTGEKIPIICGGTGFYVDAITKGIIFPEVPPDSKLRARLTQKSAMALFQVLKKLDPKRAKTIDKNNKVRLIRAIEIAKALGKVPKITQESPVYKFIKIGLYLPPDKLKKKIEQRVKKMFHPPAGGGLLREIKKLKRAGVSDKRLKEFGFEYFNPTYESVVSETLKYAKRQMTWFKRDKKIKWLDASKKINTGKLF